MGVMKMNMSQGNIEREESVEAEYAHEIMSSRWNPVIGLAQLLPEDKNKSFPVELANVDVDVFLEKCTAEVFCTRVEAEIIMQRLLLLKPAQRTAPRIGFPPLINAATT